MVEAVSDETTQNMDGDRSFEERVFARFDAIDARLDNLDSRIQKIEQKSYDTKPIWERALAEILEVKERLTSLERLSDQIVRKIDVLGKDMLTLRADQTRLEDRMDRLSSNPS